MGWFFLLGTVGVVTAGVCLYLVSRVYRFRFNLRLCRGRRAVRVLLAFGKVLLAGALCAVWLGPLNAAVIAIHFGIFFALCDLSAAVIHRIRGKRPARYYAGGIAVLLTVLYLSYGAYAAHHVSETHYDYDTEKPIGSLRIVQFADSHIGTTFDADGFCREMEKINETNPDLVVITGDFVDDGTTREDMLGACRALGTLSPTYGTYFVFGNHDKGYFGSRGYTADDLTAALHENGVTVLEDKSVVIDGRITLIGRADAGARGGRAPMEALVSGLDPDTLWLVLDHQPHDYDAQAAAGADLVLSGHTHGGQMIPINSVGRWIGENDATYGMTVLEGTTFIVTSGISDWELAFKTGCHSEYVTIDVTGQEENP